MWRLLFLLIFTGIYAQTSIIGKVQTEEGVPLHSVLVVNMHTNEKTITDTQGQFSLPAKVEDEVRFIRKGYERGQILVNDHHLKNFNIIRLKAIVQEIQEVKLLPLSGNLAKDSKLLSKEDKIETLHKQIGVPKPPEKPREKAYETKDILQTLGTITSLDIQAMYDVFSGEGKKKKRRYEYEDMQDNVKWVRETLGEEYFKAIEIPEDKISEFVMFAISSDSSMSADIKQKKGERIVPKLEKFLPIFRERLNKRAPK